MKKIILLSAVALGITTTYVVAQQKSQDKGATRITREESREKAVERAKKATDKLTEELNLSDKQQKEINAILVKDFSSTEPRTIQGNKKVNAEIESLLTPEQLTKKEAIKKERTTEVELNTREAKQVVAPAPRREKM